MNNSVKVFAVLAIIVAIASCMPVEEIEEGTSG